FADIVVGAASGGGPHVRTFDGRTGVPLLSFFAYSPTSTFNGVNVAVGDVNGDGRPDIITGTGDGGSPEVRVFDGVTGQQTASFNASPSGLGHPSVVVSANRFSSGVRVAVPTQISGQADIVVGAGPGHEPLVRVFHNDVQTKEFLAFNPNFFGGIDLSGI